MIRGFPSEGVNQRRRSLVVNENSVRAENAKISSACRHSLLEKLIEVSVQQRCNGVLNRKAWSAEKNPVSAPEHLWPAPDEFGSPGDRQNNFAESGATIFHSTRSCGPSIPGERNRSTAPQTDFAMEIAAR